MAISDITDRVRTEESLALKSHDFNELKAAYETIATGQEKLRQNEVRLTGALREKEVLLSEVHHRVKNNLTAFISLLSLDGTYEDNEGGRALRKDLQNRARSVDGEKGGHLRMFAFPSFQACQRSAFVRRVRHDDERHLCPSLLRGGPGA